jgi:hypothetical protein
MIDADRYWGAVDLVAAQHRARQPAETLPDRARAAAVERLDGGCLLYRLPRNRSLRACSPVGQGWSAITDPDPR